MSAATIIRVFSAAYHDMRRTAKALFGILMIAMTLGFAPPSKASDGPSDQEMCLAFRAYLSAQVQSVLVFVRETQGPEGLARVRRARTDQFEISSFEEPRCLRVDRMPNLVCSFSVGVATVNGVIKRTVTGYFIPKAGNQLMFRPQAKQQQATDGSGSISFC